MNRDLLLDELEDIDLAIGRRPWRAVLTGAGTMAAVAMFVFSTAWGTSAKAEVDRSFDRFSATTIMVAQNGAGCDQPLPDSLQPIRGIQAGGRFWTVGTLEVSPGVRPWISERESFDIRAMSVGALKATEAQLESGRSFTSAEAQLGLPVAMIGSVANDAFETPIRPGQHVRLDGYEFLVTGVVAQTGRLADSVVGLIIPSRTAIRYWPSSPGAGQMLVAVDPGMAEVAAGALPAVINPNRPECLQATYSPEVKRLRAEVETQIDGLVVATAVGLLVTSAFAISSAALTSVLQRRQEFGFRMAIGASRYRLARLVAGESTLIGSLAASAGLALGLAAFIIGAWVRNMPPQLPVVPMVIMTTLAMATSAIAGLPAAWRAARVDPAEALRG